MFAIFTKIRISENIKQINFLTILGGPHQKNNPRFGFLAKFCVEMYLTKNVLWRFPRFLGAYSVVFYILIVEMTTEVSQEMLQKMTKNNIYEFWWHTFRRKISRGSRFWGYFVDRPPEKCSKNVIYYTVWKFRKNQNLGKHKTNCILKPF